MNPISDYARERPDDVPTPAIPTAAAAAVLLAASLPGAAATHTGAAGPAAPDLDLGARPAPADAMFQDAAADTARRGGLDLVLLLDTSRTMRGEAGGVDIFDRVRETARGLVRGLKEGDTVSLIAFADAPRAFPTVTIRGETERERFFGLLQNVEADGDWTYTARALQVGLAEAARLDSASADHNQVVLILTDGLNNPPPDAAGDTLSLEEVTRPYRDRPWFVYQVQYGSRIDTSLADAVEDFDRGGTISDPEAEAGLDTLRPVLEEAERAGRSFSFKPEPDEVELELTRAGREETAEVTAELPPGLGADGVRVRWEGPELPEAVTLDHAASVSDNRLVVRLSALARDTVDNDERERTLRLSLAPGVDEFDAEDVEVPVRVRTAMVPPTWPYWVGGILGAALVAGLGWFLWGAWSKRQLFGTLEYWPEDEPGAKRTRELDSLGTGAVIGSSDLPLDGEEGVAELTTREVDGRRLVAVRAAEGRELEREEGPSREMVLYDRDTFTLANWRFRYRGATGRRPRRRR